MILSLFSGCGGLDLGFEQAGFSVGLAYDIRPNSINSWNHNRLDESKGVVADISKLNLADLDSAFGSEFRPTGVIGGPPCQSFSRANSSKSANDPRSLLVEKFFSIALELHKERKPIDFIAMENVVELRAANGGRLLEDQISRVRKSGFKVFTFELDAKNFGVPQRRKRLFVVALRDEEKILKNWRQPAPILEAVSVKDAIGELPEPIHFDRTVRVEEIPYHRNHWCMRPKSRRFFDSSLVEGYSSGRSFKTLSWDEPSITVSYGHREVHVHPSGRRRLSVYEAMLLQGFPKKYVLQGTLSDQIDQVSEAVPPPLGEAIAMSIRSAVCGGIDEHGRMRA